MMSDRWLRAWGLGSVAFGGASLLVPLYVVQLGGGPVELGLLAATAAIIGAPGAIAFGRIANTIGYRRPLVVATLATVAVALLVISILESVTAIVVANAALWLVVASVAPVLTMVVVDGTPSGSWSDRIGRVNTYQGWGWAGGLVLGAAWPLATHRFLPDALVTQSLFWVLAGCAAVAAIATNRTLPRPTDGHVTSDRQVRRIARIVARTNSGIRGATFTFSPNRLFWSTRAFRSRRFRRGQNPALRRYLAAATLFFTGFAAFWAPLPLFFTDVGFVTGEVFALYLVSSLGAAVSYDRVGRLTERIEDRLVQSGALALRGVLFPGVVLVAGAGSILFALGTTAVVLTVVGVTWAVIAVVGTAIVTRLAPASIRGEVLGVHTALGAVGGGIGGVLGGWAASFGYDVAFVVAGGLVVVGAAMVLSLRDTPAPAVTPNEGAGTAPGDS